MIDGQVTEYNHRLLTWTRRVSASEFADSARTIRGQRQASTGNGPHRLSDQVCLVLRHAMASGKPDVFQEQILNVGAEERFNGLACVDDGRPLDIETGVEHHFTSADFTYGLQERVELCVVRGGNGLHAGGSIHVGDGR
jgi:hypothetical protein